MLRKIQISDYDIYMKFEPNMRWRFIYWLWTNNQITITTTDDSASTSTSISPKEEPIKTEQTETSNQSQQIRQSPYATRQRNIKDK